MFLELRNLHRLFINGGPGYSVSSETVEVVEVQTVGELRRPTFHLSSTLLQATPLGHVPGRNGLSASATAAGPASMPTTPSGAAPPPLGGHPAFGTSPGRRFSENIVGRNMREASDYDETEPLGSLTTNTKVQYRNRSKFCPINIWSSFYRQRS